MTIFCTWILQMWWKAFFCIWFTNSAEHASIILCDTQILVSQESILQNFVLTSFSILELFVCVKWGTICKHVKQSLVGFTPIAVNKPQIWKFSWCESIDQAKNFQSPIFLISYLSCDETSILHMCLLHCVVFPELKLQNIAVFSE